MGYCFFIGQFNLNAWYGFTYEYVSVFTDYCMLPGTQLILIFALCKLIQE